MVKTGDFKTSRKGVVQLNTGKGGETTDAPPKNYVVEELEDFLGVQEMNVGRTAVELVVEPAVKPNFDDSPFGFLESTLASMARRLWRRSSRPLQKASPQV